MPSWELKGDRTVGRTRKEIRLAWDSDEEEEEEEESEAEQEEEETR